MESLGELSKTLDHSFSLTRAAIEMFLENGCTFYERQIILFIIVLSRSSYAQNAQAAQTAHHRLNKLNKSYPLRHMANVSKNKFNPMVSVHSSVVEYAPMEQFLLSSFYSFDSIFQA